MENKNSVAFVSRILSIKPISGADSIELATVEGWDSIIKKGSFKVGEQVACFTTDAVIPQELSESMGVTGYLRSGNRVRTIKLRGVYSECILSPLRGQDIYEDGHDLQDILGVYKYEPPEKTVTLPGGKTIKVKENSNFHVYHKFPNIKNVTTMFNQNDYVSITRKIHGTNFRAGIVKKVNPSLIDKIKRFFGNKWAEYEFVFGSHHVQKGDGKQGFYNTDVYGEAVEYHCIDKKLWNYVKTRLNPEDIGSGIILYGELYGQGIQGDKYTYGVKHSLTNPTGRELAFFDIEVNGKYLDSEGFRVLSNIMRLNTVQELYTGFFDRGIAESFNIQSYIPGTNVPHEGVVIKSIDGDRRKVAKLINSEYLTYGEKHNIPDSH